VRRVLTAHEVAPELEFAGLGNGGTARAVVGPLSAEKGRALADRYGFAAATGTAPRPVPLLVNVTPIGMAGTGQEHDLPFDRALVDRALVEQAEVMFDVVAYPSRTPLLRLAEELEKRTISGAEVIALQAAEQFALYTGVWPTADQVRRAGEFSAPETGRIVNTDGRPRGSNTDYLRCGGC